MRNLNRKTLVLSLSVILIIIFSTSLVYFIVDAYEYRFTSHERELSFYSNKLDDSKKTIFLIGNSQVWRINMTHLHDEISNFCSNCEFYNLGISADKPSKRIQSLDPLIELNPDLVIYGVGYPDFAFQQSIEGARTQKFSKPEAILPDPGTFFHKEIILPNFPNEINPKFFSLSFIKSWVEEEKLEKEISYPKQRPFRFSQNFEEKDYLVYDNEELSEKFPDMVKENSKLDPIAYEKNLPALKKIIEELERNEIKVILFTTPTPDSILSKISPSDEHLFESTIEKISKETGISVYYLHEKFSEKKIFSDAVHVTLGKEGAPYTEAIIEIVSNEVGKI